jgi:hypothetical protein
MLLTLTPVPQSPQYTTESMVRSGDFTTQLAKTGDTFTGTPTTSIVCTNGPDPNPTLLMVGSPVFDSTSMKILQRIKGGVSGAVYVLSFVGSTTQGNTWEGQVTFQVVGG